MKELKIKTSESFEILYNSKKRIVLARGGTRASKTYSIMQMLALWLLLGVFRGVKIDATTAEVVRKTMPALKATCIKDFVEIITEWGVFGLINVNLTDKTYTFAGRSISFFSVDDEQKVRGRKRDILFCNEANELNYDTDFFQLNIRTKHCIILDINPSDPYTWVKTEIEDKRRHELGDVDVFVFTYKHNGFLTAEQVREIEAISDPVLRSVYVNGEYGQVKGLIFDDVTIVENFPDDCQKVAIGLDFGYTNDPTAAVKCGIKGDNIYLQELFYEYALTNDIIAKKLPKNLEVIADSAEPKSIEDLKRAGVRASATTKGADSILFGINTLKKYNICITANSLNLLKEQKLYKYKNDNAGNPINEPIDHYNHAWDAVRYWALIKLSQPEKRIFGSF